MRSLNIPRPKTILPGERRYCGVCDSIKPLTRFPKSQRAPCKDCRNVRLKGYREKRKREAFDHYGAFCSCCGEDTYEFLTFDHIDGGGNQERVNNRKEPYTYDRVIKEGFPDRFQVLCFNCNWGKHKCGVCPHQKKTQSQ